MGMISDEIVKLSVNQIRLSDYDSDRGRVKPISGFTKSFSPMPLADLGLDQQQLF